MDKKFKIILKVNNYCNYSCTYCITDTPSISYKDYYSMDYKLLRLMVANINKYLKEYKIIYKIQGGEPTLHPYLNDIIEILAQTRNISKIRILTNSSLDFSKIIKTNYQPLEFGISIHYQQMLKHGFESSFAVILHNLKYINYTLHGKSSLNLLVDKTFPDKMQDYVIDEYTKFVTELNTIPDYSKEIIVPTSKYMIEDFNYQTLENAYNKYGNTKIMYPYRGIDISPYFQYIYNCEIIHANKNTNVLLPKTWQEIAKKLDIGVLCNNDKCPCAMCLDVE